jgi:hypothetical protein
MNNDLAGDINNPAYNPGKTYWPQISRPVIFRTGRISYFLTKKLFLFVFFIVF